MNFRVPVHKRLDYCIICDGKIPNTANKITHPYIKREQMVHLFLQHNILLRLKRRICNKLDTQHLYFNDDEVANNIPIQHITQEKVSSYND